MQYIRWSAGKQNIAPPPGRAQAAFEVWWQGFGPAAGAYGRVPAGDVTWNSSVYSGRVTLHAAGSVALHFQHGFEDLANAPLTLTVLPGPLAPDQVLLHVWAPP